MTKILIDEAVLRAAWVRIQNLKNYPTAMWDEDDEQIINCIFQAINEAQKPAKQEPNEVSRVMTVVYKNLSADDAQSLTKHPKAVWFGWCHAPYQRDDALARLEQSA